MSDATVLTPSALKRFTFEEGCVALAKDAFSSSRHAIDSILTLACTSFDLRSSFLLRHNSQDLSLELVQGYSTDKAWPLPLHARIVLAEEPAAWATWMDAAPGAPMLAPITLPVTGFAKWSPIRLPSGAFYGILVVADPALHPFGAKQQTLLDVMACRIAEELNVQRELQQLLDRQHEFVAVVSHEFRTALTSILGYTQMLRKAPYSPEEVHEFADDMYMDADRMLRLITDMLDLDRMAAGRMPLHMQPVNLNAVIGQVVTRFTVTQPSALFRLELSPTLPIIQADEDKLIQIVTNLLNNARKYTPEKSVITIGTRKEPDALHCWVRDQGPGIPPDAVETIFERFTRVETAASHIGGTGLGLPIVREIARLHGGHAWVESIPGQGATFHVTLAAQDAA
jgi:signal transduction histidine kinase